MENIGVYKMLGRNVAVHRERLRMTQAEVASRIGLTRASLANIESGRQRVMLHHIYLLLDVLELKSILDLIPAKVRRVESIEKLSFSGSATSESEQAQVERLIDMALAPTSRGRKA